MKVLVAFLVLASLGIASAVTSSVRWEIQYFYDENKSSLTLTDLVFPSAQRGLASGWITDKNGKLKPVVLVTSDSGQNWTQVPVDEPGEALHCLDETACWMVTPKALWFSSEAGRNWKRIRKEEDLTGTYFLSREKGWIFGAGKKMLVTTDSGKTWSKVPEAEAMKASEERTVFHTMIFFDAKHGVTAARSEPVVHRRDVPIWMDSDPEDRKERPTLTMLLETHDGGSTWKETSTSMFGRMTRFTRPGPSGTSLGLIEFDRFFQFPSEVYRYSAGEGRMLRSFRSKDAAITDIAMLPSGLGVIAGFQPQGALARTPVPGRLRMFESTDLQNWKEIPTDYRAVATRVSLTVVDQNQMWIATDTGMILRLVR